ncbi:MAG: hypothetical protein ACTHM1_05355 [Solirubrobacteraceae bacterium]
MSATRSTGRVALAVTMVLLIAGLLSSTTLVTGASAVGTCVSCRPWWHLHTISAPAEKAGGESEIVVEATNLGDRAADGRTSPLIVTDNLPAGVEPLTVYGEGGGGESGNREEREHSHCSIALQTVRCVYEWPLMPYEHLSVSIPVKFTSGHGDDVNEVTVSGGGAAPDASHRHLTLEDPQSFGIQNFEIAPEEEGGAPDTQAGSHPFQMTTSLGLNAHTTSFISKTGEHLLEALPNALGKDLQFQLPSGIVGNPDAIPKCNIYVFTQEAGKVPGFKCPADTIMGVATSVVNTLGVNGTPHVPGTDTSPIYNLEPSIGEPARFGFATSSPVGVVIDASVRTGGDYGVTVSVRNITQLVAFVGSQVTFWGAPSDKRHDTQRSTDCLVGHSAERYVNSGEEAACPLPEQEQPFLIMPTSCSAPAEATVEGDSWSEPGVTKSMSYTFQNPEGEPFRFDGCDRLNFEPSISVKPDGEQASTPTGLSVDVHVPQDAGLNPVGLAESAVKSITVALPEGMSVSPAGAGGLEACSEQQIALHTAGNPSCPPASKIATVKIHSPLIEHDLEGAVYLAAQNANPFGSLLAMYLVAEDPFSGVLVKLAGQVKLDERTGQLTTTFNSPELPFEDAELHFFGGSRAPLTTPALCGSYSTAASLTPWSGNPPASVGSAPFQITSGPNGGECRNPLPFAPALTAGSLNLQAGGFTPFTMTMSREDGNQNLDAIRLTLPSGLIGSLSGVKLCGEAEADAGTCGLESLIGHTTVSVGLGPDPYTVTGGQVFITGPYQGAPYGLSIVNPAKAGPFDLGHVVVRAKIEVDPLTAALTVTSDSSGPYAIPQMIDGIPLQIKHVNVTIDRPGFTFNPTNCSKLAIGASLTSSQGATSTLDVPFQVANCATLRFAPKFSVSTSGRTSRRNGASLNVKLSYPKAPFGTQANVRYVKVSLPRQLPSRLSTLQKACPDTTFDANPAACPPASRVGTARALTPVIPVPLTGPAYFVSHGGAKFPELIVVLSGYGTTVQLHGTTFISKGITTSTFGAIPDVPVGSFELKLPQGPNSALAATGNLCRIGLKLPVKFIAQNGRGLQRTVKIAASGCPKAKRKRSARKRR